MKTSKTGLDLIKKFEAVHDGDLREIGLQPKMCPAGIWTEGYGRAMRDDNGNFLKGIENKNLAKKRATIKTIQQAEQALVEDIVEFEKTLSRKIKISLNQNQHDALISYIYNTGGSNTLYQLINDKADNKLIKDWIEKHYITSNGKVLKGLILRRQAEARLFFKK